MYKMLGVTDERTTCECCGKTNLKRTVALDSDNGIVYYGSDCAAKALGQRKSAVDANVEVLVLANKWLLKYDLNIVAEGLQRRGYRATVKGDTVEIFNIGTVTK